MEQNLIDLLGLTGFSGLMAGLYLQFGMSVTLIAGGSMLLVFSLLASRNAGGKNK